MTLWNRAAPTEPGWYPWVFDGDGGTIQGFAFMPQDPRGPHGVFGLDAYWITGHAYTHPNLTGIAGVDCVARMFWGPRIEPPAWCVVPPKGDSDPEC